jgi:hypothetical protein
MKIEHVKEDKSSLKFYLYVYKRLFPSGTIWDCYKPYTIFWKSFKIY